MSICVCVFFFKQKTAYEMRISDWSSDVCSSDLAEAGRIHARPRATLHPRPDHRFLVGLAHVLKALDMARVENVAQPFEHPQDGQILLAADIDAAEQLAAFALGPVAVPLILGRGAQVIFQERGVIVGRLEEHTSQLQSLIRSSYTFFFLI